MPIRIKPPKISAFGPSRDETRLPIFSPAAEIRKADRPDQQRREQGVAQRRSVEQPDLDHPEAESGDQRVDAERHAEQQRIA